MIELDKFIEFFQVDQTHFERAFLLIRNNMEKPYALLKKVLSVFHDGYKERIEAMIKSKMKGEVAQVKEEKPKKPAAKSIMEALRATAESLK